MCVAANDQNSFNKAFKRIEEYRKLPFKNNFNETSLSFVLSLINVRLPAAIFITFPRKNVLFQVNEARVVWEKDKTSSDIELQN